MLVDKRYAAVSCHFALLDTDDRHRIARLLSSKQPKATTPPLQPILTRSVESRSMWKNVDLDLLATGALIRVAECVEAVGAVMAVPIAKGGGISRKMVAVVVSCLADAVETSLHGAVVDKLSQHNRQKTATRELRFIDR